MPSDRACYPFPANEPDDADPQMHHRLSITIREINDPVRGGERLEVTARIENPRGQVPGPVTAFLVVGHDPEVVDVQEVQVHRRRWVDVTFTFETFPVRTDVTFPVWTVVGADADHRLVRVTAAT